MAALVDSTQYNQLPSLGEAHLAFKHNSSIEDILNGPIRNAFLVSGLYNVYCLYLQHRHHTIGAEEAIVKVNGTAHLMNGEDIKDIEASGNKIVPTTWKMSKQGAIPTELAVLDGNMTAETPSNDLVSKVLSILETEGCGDLFGIDTMAKEPWSERSIGNASIVVPYQEDGRYDTDKYIPVAFSFDKEPGFKVHGRCGKDHEHTSAANPKPKPKPAK